MGADTIILNADIISESSELQSFAIKDGIFIAVGKNKEILKLKGKGTKVIDLGGLPIMPSFTDSHAHIGNLARSLYYLDLKGTESFEKVIEKVIKRKKEVKKGEWIVARGWSENLWKDKKMPDNKILNEIAPENPVFLIRIDGHTALANKVAFQVAGIDKNTIIEGGKILKDENGEPTGVLLDNAMEFIRQKIPSIPRDEMQNLLKKAMKICRREGITTIHEMGGEKELVENLFEMDKKGEISLRIIIYIDGMSKDWIDVFKKFKNEKARFVHLRGVKFVLDGALGSRGAFLKEPYSDEPTSKGLLLMSKEELYKNVESALSTGLDVAVHSIGDAAVHLLLDVYEEIRKKYPSAILRAEHLQVILPEDIERMRKLNIIASIQPQFLTSDMPWAKDRLGEERLKNAYLMKTFFDKGIMVLFGSDFPVEDIFPFFALQVAVSSGYKPEERVGIEDAIKGWTLNPATIDGIKRGAIKRGFNADFIVINKNPFFIQSEKFYSIKPLMTFMAGKLK